MGSLYLDHVATTPVADEVLEAMLPWSGPGGPSTGCSGIREGKGAVPCHEGQDRRRVHQQGKGNEKNARRIGLLVKDFGIAGDAHGGPGTGRQVSLLSVESVEKMKVRGFSAGAGDFAENLAVEGIDLPALPVGTTLRLSGGPVLEVTAVGKRCHDRGCAIRRLAGTCIMPREGVFARVVEGGIVRAGDTLSVP